MGYKVTSNGEVSYCDAIEYITARDGVIVPAEQSDADGFKAMVIVDVSPTEQYYATTLYAFPDHTLDGFDVPTGTFEEVEEETENA